MSPLRAYLVGFLSSLLSLIPLVALGLVALLIVLLVSDPEIQYSVRGYQPVDGERITCVYDRQLLMAGKTPVMTHVLHCEPAE